GFNITFSTDFYYPRPQKISTDDVAVTETAVHVSSAAADRRNKLLQDKIFNVSTSLSMNLVRYQSVLVSKNEETNSNSSPLLYLPLTPRNYSTRFCGHRLIQRGIHACSNCSSSGFSPSSSSIFSNYCCNLRYNKMEGLFVEIDCRGEWVLPFKITDQPSLVVYLGGVQRPPILRVYVDENPIKEDHNLEEDQQDMLNDEFDDVDMNNNDAKIAKDDVSDFESHNPPTPIVGSNIPCSSQSSRVNNVQDDETSFYKGMTFKNKEELENSLKIACLKKDFKLKKYFEKRFPNGKAPSTRDMSNQLRTELGCKVSYWKLYKGMEHAKSNVRGTYEHGYAVLNVVIHFYIAKAYDRCEFNDHFNQIRNMVPKAAKTLERIGFHT
ncbi:hypothetical protein H5410_046591, partial [Solanum commersonii]